MFSAFLPERPLRFAFFSTASENESRNTIEKRQIGYATTGVSAALLLEEERIDA